jgi:hypothetical protein
LIDRDVQQPKNRDKSKISTLDRLPSAAAYHEPAKKGKARKDPADQHNVHWMKLLGDVVGNKVRTGGNQLLDDQKEVDHVLRTAAVISEHAAAD